MMTRHLWIPALLLSLVYCVHHAHSGIVCPLLDEGNENVDEATTQLLESIAAPHAVQAVLQRNGKEEPRSTRRILALKRLTDMLVKENPETLAGILQEGTEQLKEKYQGMMRKNKKNKKSKKNKNKKGKKNRAKRFTVKAPNRLWPNGVINYQFNASLDDYAKGNIRYVMNMFEYFTPLRFVESAEGSNLLFVQDGSCWSYVGNMQWDSQQISSCCEFQHLGPCIHEIGHAIGFHHEHQNPESTNRLWTNDIGLPNDGWKQWFYPLSGSDFQLFDHGGDRDSPMGYWPWDFSKSYSNLQTLIQFDKDRSDIFGHVGDRRTLFYMYKEITELYMTAMPSCPAITCAFGFPSYTDSTCICACPQGLDPNTNCTTILQDDTSGASLTWVKDVALVKTNGGCPDKFDSGSFTLLGGPGNVEFDNIYNFDAEILSGTNGVPSKNLTIHFCKRTDEGTPSMTWPKGSYCYIKDGANCDPAFLEGEKEFNNGNGFDWSGTLPSGVTTSGSVTTITFCCRNDAHYTVPALFPIDTPFILFPSAGECQQVKGMQVSWQIVRYHNHNDLSNLNPSGFIPRMVIGRWYGDILLNLCYYTKVQQSCGEIYTLDANNKQVTFASPNFPLNYNNNQQCTWIFKTDPGNFFKLEFHEFHIATSPDGLADDALEIRNDLIGNNGKWYTGEGISRHIISTGNKLSVILYSNGYNPGKGFNATVTLIDKEALCYTDEGKNYDGKRNVTVYFSECLNWKDAAIYGCPHDPYSTGDEYDSLDHNYCRFPGHGRRPWCFVDYDGGCFREDCDVCNLRGCFDADNGVCDVNLPKLQFCDIMKGQCNATCNCEDGDSSCTYTDGRTDCQESLNKIPPFCDTAEGKKYCAKTCGVCDAMLNEPLTRVCDPPSISDAVIVNPSTSYNLGDVVQVQCVSRNRTRTLTCSSTGSWVPKLNYVCDGECRGGYEMIAQQCVKVVKEVFYEDAKAICEADGAHLMMHKSDSSSLVTTIAELYEQYTGVTLSSFWLGLVDSADNDGFVWEDGSPLSYTNWISKPLVLPDECRQHLPSNIYSTRAITKTGKACLFWNSAEVQNVPNNNYHPHADNYCRVFDRGTANLFCYHSSNGEVVKENCSHIPFCYNEATALFPLNFYGYNYTGHLAYTNFGKDTCSNWQDLSDDLIKDTDFVDGSKLNAKNYCRNPDRLWCYVSSEGESKICLNPDECSNDYNQCRERRLLYDGSFFEHYVGTVNERDDGMDCKLWGDTDWGYDSLFYGDGYSHEAASNFCRTLYNYRPWCVATDGNWGYCDVSKKCCQESYTRPKDYTGQRSYTSEEEKCLRWDSTELQSMGYTDNNFPDGSISDANNYCRAPDGKDYLFCHVAGGSKRWCDIPMKKNTKDCAYLDTGMNTWIPTFCEDGRSVVCEKQAPCSNGDLNIDQSCFSVHNDVSFSAGTTLCAGDGANVMMQKSDRSTVLNALQQHFVGLQNFWIGLTDANSDDQFVWDDGTELAYTNWMSKPLVLPDECRQHLPSNIYSTRTLTKTGKACLFWNSAEVQNVQNYTPFEDNYCRVFDRQTPDLFCYYNNNGQIEKEDCDHIPFCESTEPLPKDFSGLMDTYTGHLAYAYNDQPCLNWSDFTDELTDEDFVDGSKAKARNYCRSVKDLFCYVGTQKKSCVDPNTCSIDLDECRTHRKNFDGSRAVHYAGTMSINERGSACKQWKKVKDYKADWLYPNDDSAAAASNYCRPIWDAKPWCFDVDGSWGYCNIDKECCQETSYTRVGDYVGQRSFTWNEQRCLRWDSTELQSMGYTDDDFPDGSVSSANNYCRAPDGRDYLYCHVAGGSEQWCDVPMEKNTKDCTMYDLELRKWVPTFCDNVYDAVCQMPEQDLYSICHDEDSTETCKDLFSSDPLKCKDSSTVWSTTRCRKTCGHCSPGDPLAVNTETCSEPALDPSVTKVTVSSTVAIGEYFEYSCAVGTVAQGSLKRGCLPDRTLTGSSVVCVGREQINEWTNNNTMKDRVYKEGVKTHDSTFYFSTSKSSTIQKNGFLTGWAYYSLTNASLAFYVLRRNGAANNFTVLNYTTLNVVQSNRRAILELTPPNQFPVQQNDVIGWMMAPGEGAEGGVPHDTCNSEFFPDDSGDFLLWRWRQNLAEPANAAHIIPEVQQTCRVFSFAARVGPFG